MASRLVMIEGVEAVLLGGSRARGDHLPGSDYDLGIYYRPSLDVAGLGRLAREVAGPAAEVTDPGVAGSSVKQGAAGWTSTGSGRLDLPRRRPVQRPGPTHRPGGSRSTGSRGTSRGARLRLRR